MSADDVRAIAKIDREYAVESIRVSLNQVWEQLPEGLHTQLELVWLEVNRLQEANSKMEVSLADAHRLVESTQAAMRTLKDQRDMAVGELDKLTDDLLNIRTWSNNLVKQAYDDIVMEDRLAASESLPYDIADAWDNDFDAQQAKKLYELITTEVYEAGDLGYDEEQLVEWRAKLRDLLDEIQEV